jgi:hypothetical protein
MISGVREITRVFIVVGIVGSIAGCGSSSTARPKLPGRFTACIARARSLSITNSSASNTVDVKDRGSGGLVGKVEVFSSVSGAVGGFQKVPSSRAFAEQLGRYVVYTTKTASDRDFTALTRCAEADFRFPAS